MSGLLGRRDEVLALGPSGDRLLAAVEQVIRSEDAEVDVQVAGPGPWTAFYHQERLLALARPSQGGPPGAIDVSVPAAGWAATLRDDSDPGIEELRDALRRHDAGGGPGFESVPWIAGDAGGFGALIGLIALIVVAFAVVGRAITRRNQDVKLRATGGANAVGLLRAARLEASVRSSSLSIGCLASIVVGFVGVALLTSVGAWLASLGTGLLPLAILLDLIPFGIAFVAFRWVRRRFPSPPQIRAHRWLGRALVGVIALLVVAFAILAFGQQSSPITAEQEAWCLESGSGYVDNAVRALSISRTWTSGSPGEDPNFTKACRVAWDAAHP